MNKQYAHALRLAPLACILGLFMSASSLEALCVLGPKSVLRKNPQQSAPVSLEGIPYMPLEKISKKAGWYEVKDVDGQKHWIREDLVTTSFQCAVIKTPFANLREGPGESFAKAKGRRGEKYLSFRVLGYEKSWVKIEDWEGDEAWIKEDLIWIQ